MAAGIAGCGSDDDASTASAEAPPPSGDPLEFGEPASETELAQATRALRGFLGHVAARDWKAACAELAPSTVEEIEGAAGSGESPKGCAAVLAKLARLRSERLPSADARRAEVVSLRVDGRRAFAVYRDRQGALLAMPMVSEGDSWYAASLAGRPVD